MLDMKRIIKKLLPLLLSTSFVFAQTTEAQKVLYTEEQQKLRISIEDIKIQTETKDSEIIGYHLYIKKLPRIMSVLLTETTKDPNGKADNYAYRTKEYNPINGDEVRYLDGKPLVSEGAKYSLVDSTVEYLEDFGAAFHFYIPSTIIYGYEWSRNGEIQIGKGTFINIRTFEKPYADYTGNFMDNPFMFDLETRKIPKKVPEVVLTDEYNPIASEKFKEVSENVIYSKGPESIIEDIKDILQQEKDKNNLDVVFAIDATGSMKNDIDKLKADLMPALEEIFASAPDVRIGLLFYRDYGDTFNFKGLPVKTFGFTSNITTFSKNLNSIRIYGPEGGDIPEAVYEAMYAASEFYNWRTTAFKRIILIGDAEPHPTPRKSGKYSKEFVQSLADAKKIKINAILLPKD
jgi:hypothetical protein